MISLTANASVTLSDQQEKEALLSILEHLFGYNRKNLVSDGLIWEEKEQYNGSYEKYPLRKAREIDSAIYTIIQNL